ncbi:NIPSNAP family protein [Bacillus sp. V5-8f]|uniref:NIPSNAP family protein n=1 Tax=Bacillus sp. V5-8f TaxID=2053044 RepID=UPI000C763733|nr:NIPSNAP family protein [Bacillus sp. V5-8f]PLT33479.1 NIPSNAP family protein [Bacillus sp. V5-8f]
MIYEMRTYTIKIGKMQEYLHALEETGLPIITKYAKLIGFWTTEIGELNQAIHIWEYESLDIRAERRKALYNDTEWVEGFVPKLLPLLDKQESKILNPTAFSPIK